MLDEDPVIISEKDFTPTPSPSPDTVPSVDATEEMTEEMTEDLAPASESDAVAAAAADATDAAELDPSAIVSDDEDGAEIMAPELAAPAADMPTVDDVTTVERLEISISETTPPPPAVPSARQIVSIGTENDEYAFTFHEEELNAILSKVPAGWKVCVVSVVGVS